MMRAARAAFIANDAADEYARTSPPEPSRIPPEISGDGNHAIGGARLLEYVENRLAGGTGRLAVIAHAFGQSPIRASAHGGIRHVSGFRMLLTDRSHERERLVERIDMGVADKFGLFRRANRGQDRPGVLRIVCMSVFRWSTGWVFD